MRWRKRLSKFTPRGFHRGAGKRKCRILTRNTRCCQISVTWPCARMNKFTAGETRLIRYPQTVFCHNDSRRSTTWDMVLGCVIWKVASLAYLGPNSQFLSFLNVHYWVWATTNTPFIHICWKVHFNVCAMPICGKRRVQRKWHGI